MFSRKQKQGEDKSKEAQMLSTSQLDQLKQAFSDISLSSKDSSSSQSFKFDKVEEQIRQSPLLEAFGKIKNTFYDLSSRSFVKYSQFSRHLHIGKIIQTRPQLLKVNITVNGLQILAVLGTLFVPKKMVTKALLTLFTLSIQIQFIQKFLLNYYIQQIALKNNRMQPIEQQARNLIEYKYRISRLTQQDNKLQVTQPYVQRLLEKVDKKNLQYMRFKKVQLLL